MKQKFSTSWISSKRPGKQRKYRYNAPLHIRHRFLSALLSKELRKKHGKRNIPLRKGDEVLIMRGNFRKKTGKILDVDLKNSRVTVENITRTKKDGTKVNVYLKPSNLQITSLESDGKRFKAHHKTETAKTEKKESKNTGEKNAPDKSGSK